MGKTLSWNTGRKTFFGARFSIGLVGWGEEMWIVSTPRKPFWDSHSHLQIWTESPSLG